MSGARERDLRAERLVEVAIDLFGQDGKNAVGTRAIAEAAGVQMSAITYHFGGKDGLYLACAEHIAATMRARVAHLTSDGSPPRTRGEAQRRIEEMLSGLVVLMMAESIAPIARFVVREQMRPTPAFDILYEGAIRPLLDRLAALVSIVAHDAIAPADLRLTCFTLIGPVLACRFGRATLMRAAGWDEVGEPETERVRARILANARAALNALAVGSPE